MKQIKIVKTSIYPQGTHLIHRSAGDILSIPEDIDEVSANKLVIKKFAIETVVPVIEIPAKPILEKKVIEKLSETKVIKKKTKKK